MSIFFTSDLHLSHENIIKYCNRPFENIKDMDEQIISNWNSKIKNNDIVYFLGDFSWTTPINFINKLNGNITIILGNHDYKWLNVFKYKTLCNIKELYSIKVYNQDITLCHYCLRVWNKSHFNSWHLYGHSHGTLPSVGKSLDVGVDCNNFFPFSFDEIFEIMKNKPNNENYIT